MNSHLPSRFAFTTVLLLSAIAMAQDAQEDDAPAKVIPLWENGAPGFEDRRNEPEEAKEWWVKNIHNPSITAYLPAKEKAKGAAVVICPGGGHRLLVLDAEGTDAAKYFNEIGVAAFVLKYRLGRQEGSPYKIEEHALADGQRAMRTVRSRAEEWGIDPTRIGIMGFSAGGEVVSMVSYASHGGNADAKDPVERISARPDFQILVYPGPLGIPEKLPENAPPAFLTVTNDDVGASRAVVSLLPKFREAGVPVELHLYARGGHAFNMGRRTPLKSLKEWSHRLTDWMTDNFILDPAGREEWKQEHARLIERMRWHRDKMHAQQIKEAAAVSANN